MSVRSKLLGKGLFPKELPPCFSSKKLESAMRACGFNIPQQTPFHAHLASHSLARAGGVRRTLSLPNPILYTKLCGRISGGWKDIVKHIGRSGLTISAPKLTRTKGRGAVPAQPLGDLALARASHRKNGRYFLFADISECYRSLYTHSIPWALHGKAFAKANRADKNLLGNQLDAAVRNLQDQQTNGIPIGPDTSLVIGEIILSAIDQGLHKRFSRLNGFRYYDDYEFSFKRYGDAEEVLATIQGLLSDYGLQLNPAKTRICEPPQPMEMPWVLEVRDFDFRQHQSGAKQRIIRFFDQVFARKSQQKDSYVLAYAISRVEQEHWLPEQWDLIQSLLLQATNSEPSAIQQLVTAMATFYVKHKEVDFDSLSELLNDMIATHAPMRHASEVAWALWGLLSFKLKLTKTAVDELAVMDDSIVALLALDAHERGLARGLDTTLWASFMTGEELYRSHWLIAYEALVRGWLPSVDGSDYIGADPAFAYLKAQKVRFYNEVRTPTRKTLERLEVRRGQSYGDTDEAEDESETVVDLEDL